MLAIFFLLITLSLNYHSFVNLSNFEIIQGESNGHSSNWAGVNPWPHRTEDRLAIYFSFLTLQHVLIRSTHLQLLAPTLK